MNAPGCLLLLVIAALLAAVVPDVVLNPAYFHGPGVLIANAILLPLSLGMFVGIEKWAEKITGYAIPAFRRLMIPVPALFWLAGFVKVLASRSFYSPNISADFCAIAMLLSLVVLPFLLLEEVRTPILFILGVWVAYALWLLAFVVVMIRLGLLGPP